jgi:hypothetical protein
MYPECRHILPKGTKCKSPALRGKVYCYFHDRLQRFEQDGQRCTNEPLCLPPLEDAQGIQIAICQVLAALGSARLETRKAGLYLYGLQLATQLLAQVPLTFPDEMVRTVTCDGDGRYISAEEIPPEPMIEGNAGSPARKLRLDVQSAGQVIESEAASPSSSLQPTRRQGTPDLAPETWESTTLTTPPTQISDIGESARRLRGWR